MGQTKKRNYDRYTLAFKQQAVKLANHPSVTAKDIAEGLGIHVVMLYRWRMEHKNGELRENRHMKPPKSSLKRRKTRTDPAKAKDDELIKANKRIRELEKTLGLRTEELDLLKKARRFFEKARR
ncbi:transposase [Thiogranum longum]|uniref:Transposase n=1 Tax=Thiogranum longum TaxID=1537524 RepID=A0A4V2PGX5_9GAMM|nr:transposase [Thiogranum longum]TCK18566.1 transposase [Thiogranum longum]